MGFWMLSEALCWLTVEKDWVLVLSFCKIKPQPRSKVRDQQQVVLADLAWVK